MIEPVGGLTFEERLKAFRAAKMLKAAPPIPAQAVGIKTAKVEKEEFIPMVLSRVGAYLALSSNVDDLWEFVKEAQTVLMVKPVQSGKTSNIYKIIEHLFKTHLTLMVSAKNKALAEQTNGRGRSLNWVIKGFS